MNVRYEVIVVQSKVFPPPGVYTAHCFVMISTVTGAFTVCVCAGRCNICPLVHFHGQIPGLQQSCKKMLYDKLMIVYGVSEGPQQGSAMAAKCGGKTSTLTLSMTIKSVSVRLRSNNLDDTHNTSPPWIWETHANVYYATTFFRDEEKIKILNCKSIFLCLFLSFFSWNCWIF